MENDKQQVITFNIARIIFLYLLVSLSSLSMGSEEDIKELPSLVHQYLNIEKNADSSVQQSDLFETVKSILGNPLTKDSDPLREAFKQTIDWSREEGIDKELFKAFLNSANNPMAGIYWKEYTTQLFQLYENNNFCQRNTDSERCSAEYTVKLISELFRYKNSFSQFFANIRSYGQTDSYFLEAAFNYGSELLPYLISNGLIASPWSDTKTDLLKRALRYYTTLNRNPVLFRDQDQICQNLSSNNITCSSLDSKKLIRFLKIFIDHYQYEADEELLTDLADLGDQRVYNIFLKNNNGFFYHLCSHPHADANWCLNTAVEIVVNPSSYESNPFLSFSNSISLKSFAVDYIYQHSNNIATRDIEYIIESGKHHELYSINSKLLQFSQDEWDSILLKALQTGDSTLVNWVVSCILLHYNHFTGSTNFPVYRYDIITLLNTVSSDFIPVILESYNPHEHSLLFSQLVGTCQIMTASKFASSDLELEQPPNEAPYWDGLAFKLSACFSAYDDLLDPVSNYSDIKNILNFIIKSDEKQFILELIKLNMSGSEYLYPFFDFIVQKLQEKPELLPIDLAEQLYNKVSSELMLLLRKQIRQKQDKFEPFIIRMLENLAWIKKNAGIKGALEYSYNHWDMKTRISMMQHLIDLDFSNTSDVLQKNLAIYFTPLLNDFDFMYLYKQSEQAEAALYSYILENDDNVRRMDRLRHESSIHKYDEEELVTIDNAVYIPDNLEYYTSIERSTLFSEFIEHCQIKGASQLLAEGFELSHKALSKEDIARNLAHCATSDDILIDPLSHYSDMQSVLHFLVQSDDSQFLIELIGNIVKRPSFLFLFFNPIVKQLEDKPDRLPIELAELLYNKVSSESMLLIRRYIANGQYEFEKHIIDMLMSLPWIKRRAGIQSLLEYTYNHSDPSIKISVIEDLIKYNVFTTGYRLQEVLAVWFMPLLADNAFSYLYTESEPFYFRSCILRMHTGKRIKELGYE